MLLSMRALTQSLLFPLPLCEYECEYACLILYFSLSFDKFRLLFMPWLKDWQSSSTHQACISFHFFPMVYHDPINIPLDFPSPALSRCRIDTPSAWLIRLSSPPNHLLFTIALFVLFAWSGETVMLLQSKNRKRKEMRPTLLQPQKKWKTGGATTKREAMHTASLSFWKWVTKLNRFQALATVRNTTITPNAFTVAETATGRYTWKHQRDFVNNVYNM